MEKQRIILKTIMYKNKEYVAVQLLLIILID